MKQLHAALNVERHLHAGQRHALRGQEAPQILAAFKAWLDEEAPKVLPKSPMGEAITYAFGQWEALTRYLEDGILEIDNNRAERALRRVAIGRKNWMFAGSDRPRAAERPCAEPEAEPREVSEGFPAGPVRPEEKEGETGPGPGSDRWTRPTFQAVGLRSGASSAER